MSTTLQRTTAVCPHCGRVIHIAPEQFEQFRGQSTTCKQCQRVFTIAARAPAQPLPVRCTIAAPLLAPPLAAPPGSAEVSARSFSAQLSAPRVSSEQPTTRPPQYQCVQCTGSFTAAHVYALPNSDGYLCRRCHAQNFQASSPAATAPRVLIQNIVHPPQRWNPGVAALLSFIFPGLGQIYKGQVINGLVWMVVIFIGYLLLVIPGLLLHVCCIIGAATGDPRR